MWFSSNVYFAHTRPLRSILQNSLIGRGDERKEKGEERGREAKERLIICF